LKGETIPALERWLNPFIYEVFYRLFPSNVMFTLQESEAAKVTKSVNEILHLVHHDFSSIVDSM
jgi:hypothetical protein